MIYLLLAVASSALVSVVMRLSTNRVSNNTGMLVMNYVMCMGCAAAVSGLGTLFPHTESLPPALLMGAFNGFLYLAGFVLLQASVRRNGVVLSSTFMKLGLLVPMVMSVFLFGERPDGLQILGFCIAVGSIVLIHFEKEQSAVKYKTGLILVLLAGGAGDAMSKVFEEVGDPALSGQFLLYTFASAFLLCTVLMLKKKERIGRQELLFGLLIGVPNFFSARFLLMALNSVPAIIVYPTYSVATILVVTLAGVGLFREKLGKRQWTALIAILAALVLLNI